MIKRYTNRHILYSHFCTTHYRENSQTDHAILSVTIGHIYVHSTAMQPSSKHRKFWKWKNLYQHMTAVIIDKSKNKESTVFI